MYQPTTSAAMRRHNGQPPNAACAFPPRRMEGLSNRITFSFGPPPPLVLRRPKRPALACPPPRREDCLHAGKNRGAPESAKRCDTFVPFTERRGLAGRSRTRMRAAHGQEFGGRRLRRRFAASSRHLGIREPETHRHQRLPPRQRQRQRHAAWPPSGLRRHAVSTGNRFAARPPPQDSASPQVLVHGVGTTPRRGRSMPATSVLCPRPGPRFYAAPPYAAEHCSTFANPQTLYSCPGLKTTAAFRPSPPANALRLRRPVAVLRLCQSAAQLYAVVDL